MIETDLLSDNHPAWLCIHNMTQLQYRTDYKETIAKTSALKKQSNRAMPVAIIKNGIIHDFKSKTNAAEYLKVNRQTLSEALDTGSEISGWTIKSGK